MSGGTKTKTTPAESGATAETRAARFRIGKLLDPGSVVVHEAPDDSGVLAADGTAYGCEVVVFATDAAVMGGAMGRKGCLRIVAAIERAVERGVPVIGIWHSGGARLQDGVDSLDAVGAVFAAMIHASGVVPQISLVLGAAAGGAAYGPALTDVVIMGPEGRVFVTGPDVVRKVTGEEVTQVALGGPEPHGRRSGVVHLTARTEAHAYRDTRRLAALLAKPLIDTGVPLDGRDLGSLLPESLRRAYDVRPIVTALLDEAPLELHAGYARNIVTAIGRLDGRTVGVVANNPLRLAGCLDSNSAEKAARFVRMCDALNIPLVVVVDVPGYLPGTGQEWNGVVRRGAKLLYAFAEATVPRVTLITRKAYGGAYIAMNSRSLGATKVLAWPTAEVAVMGATAAVEILHRRTLAATHFEQLAETTARLVAEHEETAGGVGKALELGLVDAVVDPADTRKAISAAIAEALTIADEPDTGRRPRFRHGNIPL